MCGPSTLEIMNSIRSPSPDFGTGNIDDLIRTAPDSALDANMFGVAVDLTVGDTEEVSSPPDVLKASWKRLRDSAPGPSPTAKRMKNISDRQDDIEPRGSRPMRPHSVQEVGYSSMGAVPGRFLTLGRHVGCQVNLQTSFVVS